MTKKILKNVLAEKSEIQHRMPETPSPQEAQFIQSFYFQWWLLQGCYVAAQLVFPPVL